MTQQNDSDYLTMTSGAALAKFRMVKLDSTNDRQVVATGAGEAPIGITQEAASASGEKILIKKIGAGGTQKVTAAKALATRNGLVYPGASGRISDASSGTAVGRNLDTASATEEIVEMLPAGP